MDHFVCAQEHGDALAHVDLDQHGGTRKFRYRERIIFLSFLNDRIPLNKRLRWRDILHVCGFFSGEHKKKSALYPILKSFMCVTSKRTAARLHHSCACVPTFFTLNVRVPALGVFAEVSRAVAQHVGWRFHHWYAHPEVLLYMAGPLLRHLANRLKEAAANDTNEKQRKNVSASGAGERESERQRLSQTSHVTTEILLTHDVTILALHHALSLGHDRHLKSTSTCDDDQKPQPPPASSLQQLPPQWWWPPYGSAIVLQLTATSEDENANFQREATARSNDRNIDQHNQNSSSSYHSTTNNNGWGAGYQLHMYATPWEGLSLPLAKSSLRSDGGEGGDDDYPLRRLRSSVPAKAFEL